MYSSKDMSSNYSGIIRLQSPNASKKTKVEISDFEQEYGSIFAQMVRDKLREIYAMDSLIDPSQSCFAQCEDDRNCLNCPFLSLCQRSPKSQSW